ncbi:FMN-dependent NADH-azoreductase [Anaerosporobacter mobilis DSM 15930]|jgi:FMN-dependent NADH-azoreductase|uniref:FMN dependent NADH:quinone oxidoreductase n=1 Tax=Anaerosporobacter mobilis DSM 15930 TaxID=1120996 RepID=A0A1M7MHS5_9FIRM|nr:FMN-dependent NADH-azoreductase [Anaerosporobacter mobilis]SHM90394.1 FMN-dependent NADH-azoreductase [Anaerosporobacter mobilis DSM 15930]
MKKILYIKANIKKYGDSRTFKISDRFVEEYKKNNPDDEVIVLDLYKERIGFLRPEDLEKLLGKKDDEARKNSILKYVYQFVDADKYIIAAPMWNLSIPAILKAYMDYVCASGITFKYTENGPVGLCKGKKAVHIVSRGGNYSEGPAKEYEMGDRYLRTIFAFFGITDFTTIAADKLDDKSEDVEAILNQAIIRAMNVAKEF